MHSNGWLLEDLNAVVMVSVLIYRNVSAQAAWFATDCEAELY